MTNDETSSTAEDASKRKVPFYAGDVRVEGETLDFLLRLLDTPAPSGFEEPAAEAVAEYARGWADDVRVDSIGNVHVTVNRGAAGPRVMLSGHIDEIGFVVTRIDDNGLIRFEQVGGWDLAVPVGQRVRVLTRQGALIGTVGKLAPHQMRDRAKAPTLKDMWIDVGVASGDEAKALVRIGDPIVLDTSPHVFPNRRIMSRSVDDRLGAFVALEVARRAKGADVEVVAMCATREEIGCVGAMPGAYGCDPDEAIAIDVTWTSDVPGDHAEDADVGKGPTVTFGAATRARIGRELVQIAEDAGIDIQISASGRYTATDADTIVRAGRGIPVGVVSIPTRYLHSPGELFALEDAEAAIDLLVRWTTRTR